MASDRMVYWLALWTSTQMIGVQILLSPQTFFFFFPLVLQKIKYYSLKKPKTQLKNCSFNFIFLNIFSMHLLHKIIKWSQKF